MPGQYYPVGIYTSPFVYYKSLEETDDKDRETKGAKLKANTLKGASQYLDTFKSQLDGNVRKTRAGRATNNDTALMALSFLKKAAEVERNREIEIIKQNLDKLGNDELGQKLRDAVSGASDNYYDFIIALNASIKGIDEAKKDIEDELNRLLEYRRRYNNYLKKLKEIGKNSKNLTRDDIALLRSNQNTDIWDERISWTTQNQRTGRDLRTDKTGEGIFKAIFSKRSDISELVQGLLQDNIDKIFRYSNGKFDFQPKHLAVITRLITQKYNELLIEELGKESNDNSFRYRKGEYDKTKNKLSSAIDAYLQELMNSPNIAETLDNYAELYNITDDGVRDFKGAKYRYNQAKQLVANAYKKYKEEGGSMTQEEWQKERGIDKAFLEKFVRSVDVVKVQIHYTSEVNSAEAQRRAYQNGISEVIGKKQGATDVHTRGNFVVEIIAKEDEVDKALAAQEKYQKELLARNKAAKNKATNVGKMSTVKEAEDNEKLFSDMLEEQEQMAREALAVLTKKEREYINLKGIFNIHNSVKDYATIGVKVDAFSGATLGADLETTLTNFSNVASSAASIFGEDANLFDTQWFQTALINTAPGLIGQENKPVLESYLSIFASFFMFSDARQNVAQIAKEITGKAAGLTKNVHVYNLNGTFYPQSYILTRLYEQLSAKYNEYSAEAFSQQNTALQVRIHNSYTVKANFKNHKDYKERGDWNMEEWYEEAAAALKATTLSMTMMKNFIQELQNLFDNFNP